MSIFFALQIFHYYDFYPNLKQEYPKIKISEIRIEKETIVAANSLSNSSNSEKIRVLKPTGAAEQRITISEIGCSNLNPNNAVE